MGYLYALIKRKGILIVCVQCLFLSSSLLAQQTSIKDFVLFGGTAKVMPGQKPCDAPGYAVQLEYNCKIEGGAVGSCRLVKSVGNTSINANIYSGGKVELFNNNSITGNITAANFSYAKGIGLLAGGRGHFTGNIDVNGNIVIGYGSTINGKVTHPDGTTYNGPVPSGGEVEATPALAVMPVMPAVTPLPACPHLPDIINTTKIAPGIYDDVKLPGNVTLTLYGPGNYYFDKISNRGPVNNLVFDFKNNPGGTFKIYILNNADFGKINVTMINGGSATRIYTEVHGDGLNMENGKYCFQVNNCRDNVNTSRWLGTVWAPYGAINIGSSSGNSFVTGALWSGTQVRVQCGVTLVYAPFSECSIPDVSAGPDDQLNSFGATILTGSSKTKNVQFRWQALNGGTILSGANTANPGVSTAGTYVVTALAPGGCEATDTVIVKGKIINTIGSELDALADTRDSTSAVSKAMFQINNGKVLMEIVAMQGRYRELLSLLLSTRYGLTDTISNGPNTLIITGYFPIANLRMLDSLNTLINQCRPVYPPLGNSGIIQTAGDSAMRTNYVRNGFGVAGNGVKVGVISDSYNTLPGNPAANDMANGDLPGPGDATNPNAVHVLKEYPLGRASDEGRAMLQIVHDVAPKANLSFRTGFISAGDFAQGIRELANDSCNVIVDDVTYITEPFFKTGIVEKAINEVTAAGVKYVTAAGNFGIKSYEGMFNPANTPNGLPGRAHNFGNGDILQSDSVKGTVLTPGVYSIVLQWTDDIYSLGSSATGTQNDLDIYLADATGTSLFGVNRNNIGQDPLEVMTFTVTSNTTVNVMVVNSSAPAGSTTSTIRFKYVVFRGDLKINEFQSNSSTIVGHANAAAAITVGAALYSNTPAFGMAVPTIASFSSTGGTPVNNIVPAKPDVVAPNGVNTSVNFGSIDYEGDGIPNFFGTSAAAPHVAGAVALLLEAKKKFANADMAPAEVSSLLHTSSINMGTPGFDFTTGYGFIQADAAVRAIANPKPFIKNLQLADSSIQPGVQPVGLVVNGLYLSSGSKIILGQDTLATTVVSDTKATAMLPVFYGERSVTVFTSSKSVSALDGGISNAVSITGLAKRSVLVIADNKTKKYAATLPAFTATVLVDGDSLQHTGLTVQELGLTDIVYQTPVTAESNTGIYAINPSKAFDSTGTDSAILKKYTYAFTAGVLTVQKLAVKITARDTTLSYGEKPGNFTFNYAFDSSVNIDNPAALAGTIQASHQGQFAGDFIGLINKQAVTIVNKQAVPIVNGQAVTIVNGQAVTIVNGQAIPIVNSQAITIVNGQAVTIVNNLNDPDLHNLNFLTTETALQNARQVTTQAFINGATVTQTTNIIDITQESILNFNINSAQTSMLSGVSFTNARGLVDASSLTSKQAVTIVNGQAINLVNKQAIPIVNGQAVTIVNGQAVTIVNGQAIPIVNSSGRTAVVVDEEDIGKTPGDFKALNMVTGLSAGIQTIIPGAFSDDNFDISYGYGKLVILPACITLKAKDTTKVYGTTMVFNPAAFTIAAGTLSYDDTIKTVCLNSEGAASTAPGGFYPIIASGAAGAAGTYLSNYKIAYACGILNVLKATLFVKADSATKIYGDNNPPFTATYKGLLNGQTFATSNITGMPSFASTAAANSTVGNYNIAVSTGSLSSPSYAFNFTAGVLTILKASLNVKADDKYIFRGDPLPAYSATFTTLKAGDKPCVDYSLDAFCFGRPGAYAIIPVLKPFGNHASYDISYTNGTLYINPKGRGAMPLKPYLDCVEQTSTGGFIAHFYCINNNGTPVYIPAGADNLLSSSGTFTNTVLPAVFMPGTTKVNVPFDGNTLRWALSAFDCYNKITLCATADGASNKCNVYTAGRVSGNQMISVNSQQDKMLPEAKSIYPAGNINVYPNPVKNRAVVYFANDKIIKPMLFDAYGKTHPLKVTRNISDHAIEIDLTGLTGGSYFIGVNLKEGFKTVRVVKE